MMSLFLNSVMVYSNCWSYNCVVFEY